MMHVLKSAYEIFGRDASDVDAGAADRTVTDERHPSALLGSGNGGGKAGGARPDHGKIVGFTAPAAGCAAVGHVRPWSLHRGWGDVAFLGCG